MKLIYQSTTLDKILTLLREARRDRALNPDRVIDRIELTPVEYEDLRREVPMWNLAGPKAEVVMIEGVRCVKEGTV